MRSTEVFHRHDGRIARRQEARDPGVQARPRRAADARGSGAPPRRDAGDRGAAIPGGRPRRSLHRGDRQAVGRRQALHLCALRRQGRAVRGRDRASFRGPAGDAARTRNRTRAGGAWPVEARAKPARPGSVAGRGRLASAVRHGGTAISRACAPVHRSQPQPRLRRCGSDAAGLCRTGRHRAEGSARDHGAISHLDHRNPAPARAVRHPRGAGAASTAAARRCAPFPRRLPAPNVRPQPLASQAQARITQSLPPYS